MNRTNPKHIKKIIERIIKLKKDINRYYSEMSYLKKKLRIKPEFLEEKENPR